MSTTSSTYSSSSSRKTKSTLNELESLRLGDRESECDHRAGAINKNLIQNDTVFSKYTFNYIPPDLPIVSSRSEILTKIHDNPVIVLQGSTGCGKSTQVPQFILDESFHRSEYCNIVVTQPRRIAAQSISARVSKERKWNLGTVIGYQVGMQQVTSEDTRLLYCTTGVLLEKLIRSKTMSNYTHIILDEVHERDQDMDFLFIVVRRLLATTSPHVKIILMSATIEAPQFANYFSLPNDHGTLSSAPIINVERKRAFAVKEFYLCQLDRLKISAEVNFHEPGISAEMYIVAARLIIILDRLDDEDKNRPTVLIFLPGILEIQTMALQLKDKITENQLEVVPLHAVMSSEDQQRAFRAPTKGFRKVILCTNIAESSITIQNVKYVIDFCLTKALVTDSATNFTSLKLDWASRNNCIQRAGRTGRVMNGRCYRLVPQYFYENLMTQSAKPEILRSPLERIVLKSKLLDMGPPHSILALAMDQPDLSDIDNTILVLKELGAVLRTCDGVLSEHDGDLTFMGRVMSSLPIDIRVSRLIILGHCFSVLEECIIIGAGLTVKSIFNSPFEQPLEAYGKKLRWSDSSGSDLFAILKAYRSWCSQHEQLNFSASDTERMWTRRYYLNLKSLQEMANLITEITERLNRVGIVERTGVRKVKWSSAEKSIILKCVIAGAFYPNYFFRSDHYEQMDKSTFQTLGGRDPNTTVYFSGFNQKYIGQLYTSAIKDMFRECDIPKRNIKVSFDSTCEKIFVTFKQEKKESTDEYLEALPGKVATEVYKAVKLRKVRPAPQLRVMHPRDAIDLAELNGLGNYEGNTWVPKAKFIKNIEMLAIPRPLTKHVFGIITYIESPYRFFFRSMEEETLMQNIYDELNENSDIIPIESDKDVVTGQILAAPFNNHYQRAKVIYCTKSECDTLYQVNFIDFGQSAEVQFSELRRFRGVSAEFADIPPRVFECRLAEIQPSSLRSEKTIWTPEAIHIFSEMVENVQVCAEVYSVVNRVASVIVRVDDDSISEFLDNANVNEYLVTQNVAQKCEEPYLSKPDSKWDLRLMFDEYYFVGYFYEMSAYFFNFNPWQFLAEETLFYDCVKEWIDD